jgi:hypothetical protein
MLWSHQLAIVFEKQPAFVDCAWQTTPEATSRSVPYLLCVEEFPAIIGGMKM